MVCLLTMWHGLSVNYVAWFVTDLLLGAVVCLLLGCVVCLLLGGVVCLLLGGVV